MAAVRGSWRPFGLNIKEKGVCDQGNIREKSGNFVIHFLWEPCNMHLCTFLFILKTFENLHPSFMPVTKSEYHRWLYQTIGLDSAIWGYDK